MTQKAKYKNITIIRQYNKCYVGKTKTVTGTRGLKKNINKSNLAKCDNNHKFSDVKLIKKIVK